MKNEEIQPTVKAISQPLREVLAVFIAFVNALREQPGFDDATIESKWKSCRISPISKNRSVNLRPYGTQISRRSRNSRHGSRYY